ncbi:transposon Ty3-G Gag-Pol polyprotein [Pseudoscourfieldia marina]
MLSLEATPTPHQTSEQSACKPNTLDCATTRASTAGDDAIPRMSEVSEPLRKLLKKGADWAWGAHEQRAMDRLKELLCTPGVGLHHVDPARPLYLHTDWSNYGMGALLGQIDDDGNERLCGCISRSLNE